MANESWQGILDAVDQNTYAALLFQSLGARPILMGMATRHDMNGNGESITFQNYSAISDTDVVQGDGEGDDEAATTYTALSPHSDVAQLEEFYVAIKVSTLAQATRPGTDPLRWLPNMMDALALKLEKALLTEALAVGSKSAGGVGQDFDVDTAIASRATFGGYTENMLGWVLAPSAEAALISDPAVLSANNYGSSVAIVEGQVARVLGAPVFVSPHITATKSLLVGRGVLNYAVAPAPSFRVQYDSDSRTDRVVATLIAAVKAIEVNHSVITVITNS